jgi:hypothetical protein
MDEHGYAQGPEVPNTIYPPDVLLLINERAEPMDKSAPVQYGRFGLVKSFST